MLLPLLAGCEYYGAYHTLPERAGTLVHESYEHVKTDRQQRLRRVLAEERKDQDLVRADRETQAREMLRTGVQDANKLSLVESQKLAVTFNRDFASQRDANTSAALGLISAR